MKDINSILREKKNLAISEKEYLNSEDQRAWDYYLSIWEDRLKQIAETCVYIQESLKYYPESCYLYEKQLKLFLYEKNFILKCPVGSDEIHKKIYEDFRDKLRKYNIIVTIEIYESSGGHGVCW